jgi:hypothetical protein
MLANYQITKRNLVALVLLIALLLTGCGMFAGPGARGSFQDTTAENTNAPTPATITLAEDTTSTQDEPALWTWIVTQNDKVTHLFCENKPVFANGAAECQQENGVITYVPQGPLVEVRPGRVELQQNLGEYTWIVNQVMSGVSSLRVARLYCINPPNLVNGFAECIHQSGARSYVSQGVPIVAIPGFTEE